MRRLAIAGTLPHTVVCRGTRKTTRRYPRRFADDFAASGLDMADLAAFAAPGGRGSPRPPVTARPPRHRTPAPPAPPRPAGVTGLRAAAPTLTCSSPAAASRPSPRGRSARDARSGEPCLDYAISHGITHGIWGGLAERDRRPLRTRHVSAARRERDAAIAAASAAGYTTAAIGRAFGLAATSVSRVLSRDADRRGRS